MQKGKHFEALFCPWPICIVNFDLVDAVAVFIELGVACSRLQDSGGKSFSKKKCKKRMGAGETKSLASLFSLCSF